MKRLCKSAVLCVSAVLGASGALGCDKLVTYEPAPERRVAEIEKQSLDEARALAAKNDLDGAHAKVSQIKPDSPLRSTPEVVDIEDRWARQRIEEANREPDKTKKLAMLDEVARAPYVSGELRARANDALDKANPTPALPPPPGPPYNVQESEQAVAQAEAFAKQHHLKDAQELLLQRYRKGPVSPKETSLLASLCVQNKDRGCIAVLIDGGALTPDAASAQNRVPGPGPTRR